VGCTLNRFAASVKYRMATARSARALATLAAYDADALRGAHPSSHVLTIVSVVPIESFALERGRSERGVAGIDSCSFKVIALAFRASIRLRSVFFVVSVESFPLERGRSLGLLLPLLSRG
jgi:hypothetical protein